MISIKFNTHPITQQAGIDAVAIFLPQGFSDDLISSLDAAFSVPLSSLIIKKKFTGSTLSSLVVSGAKDGNPIDLICIGLGKKNAAGHIDIETYRRAVGKAIRTAECRSIESLALQMPASSLFGVTDSNCAEQTASIAQIASYKFDTFITKNDADIVTLKTVICVAPEHNEKEVAEGIARGSVIATAVNQARHWIDLPPAYLTPVQLGDYAQDIAKKHDLKIQRFSEKEVAEMGMGGLHGVSRGSNKECQLVIMEYKYDSSAPTIGFVGKGITFDSGGLSLKPPTYMETMKEDMSGAAAVISAMDALAQLKPKVNIVMLAPLSENLPSGTATKPGDIVTFYNGKTAEVKNTDAEGRLVLADALSYAVEHYKLDALIDLATLTGACAHALGPFFTGLMSQHDDFSDKVVAAAQLSGDRVWRLPFNDDYKKAIKSSVADICNIGSKQYMAGAITAGFFLQNFVKDVPWVHLDIAGTAFNVPDLPYYRIDSATGVGVRLLVELACNWK